MEVPSREEFGMVWTGDMLLQNESNDMIMEQTPESPFFVDAGTQSLTEDEIRYRNQMGIEGFMMLDDLDDTARWYVNGVTEDMLMDNEQTSSTKLVTTATQTILQNSTPGSRKIKPVKHPGLKLQTPIAYQRDTDLNVIPIQKDGRAVCKKCGAIGVKHAFYTRERRYCSLACARGSVESDMNQQEMLSSPSNTQWSEETSPPPEPSSPTEVVLPEETSQPHTLCLGMTCDQAQYVVTQPTLVESQLPPVYLLRPEETFYHVDKRTISKLTQSYDWNMHLNHPYFTAAPTSCFRHAPMADLWHYVDFGLKVEVENTDCDSFSDDYPNIFWIATVLKVEGYKALLRYEGFFEDGSKDFWVNMCSSSVHEVGWCATRGKPLIPPNTIRNKYSNWLEILKKRLSGHRTLPKNFYAKVQDSLKSRFRCELTLEVVDKNKISQVKVATIERIVGKRLKLRYYDLKSGSSDVFWAHEDSPHIHPVGWAKTVGQKIACSPQYYDRVMKGLREKDDATPDLFVNPEMPPLAPNCSFHEGMKLEAVDPLNLSDICVATVTQVLNDGYLMLSFDYWNDQQPTSDNWFCYHMSSPCIFPAGFCAANNIPLRPPKEYDGDCFNWDMYLQKTGCVAAPAFLFNREIPTHCFEIGMKCEAADIMHPNLVCVATIIQVVGRLLRVQFDGWGKEYDQWMDCESCDLYPVGWCELVQHKLEPPYCEEKPAPVENKPTHRRGRPPRNRHAINNTVLYKPSIQLNDSKLMILNDPKLTDSKIMIQLNDPKLTESKLMIQLNDTKLMEFNDVKESLLETSAPDPTSLGFVIEDNSSECILEPRTHIQEWNTPVDLDNDSAVTPVNTCDTENANNEIMDDVKPSIGESESSVQSHVIATASVEPPSQSPVLSEQSDNCIVEQPKIIPRLSDHKTRGSSTTILMPETWDVNDVAEFLKINDCSAYCDAFINQGIDGKKLLELTKEEVHALVNMKVGPSLKIQNLITQLNSRINITHSRQKTSKKVL